MATYYTTPEELFAAAHAVRFGIALRSVLAQRGGSARRVRVTATVTAEKGGTSAQGIRVLTSRLTGIVEGLDGVEAGALSEIASAAEAACTISAAIRGTVGISVDISST
jgi:lipoyl-dependent peroxiredoxin